MQSSRAILWDFDGTLAARSGLWSDLAVEILDLECPGHGFVAADFRAGMSTGFPWHDWDRPHPQLGQADDWWRSVSDKLRRSLVEVGVGRAVAARASDRARAQYLQLDHWRLYPDTEEVLDQLTAAGWRHAILSNHVPELPELVHSLGIRDRFEAVLTSAATGFEKPHLEAFVLGRAALGDPTILWMVGDNPVADIEGARRAGIAGVLVRQPLLDRPGRSDLRELVETLAKGGRLGDM